MLEEDKGCRDIVVQSCSPSPDLQEATDPKHAGGVGF
jgi:hypothetical protein